MISIQTNINEIVERLRNFAAAIPGVGEAMLDEAVGNIRERMANTPGSPVRYPVDWDSDRQRRAFFATDGFGAGIPYHRTGDYQRGFTTERIHNGVLLKNVGPAGAIAGTAGGWQSRIHRGRWITLAAAVFQELYDLPRRVIERLTVAFDNS